MRPRQMRLSLFAILALALAACAPAAQPSPTAAPAKPAEAAKPAATTAPAKPTEAPAAKPADAKPVLSKAEGAAASPAAAAKPAEAKPAASPAAKPAEAKPAASPAAKAAFDEKSVSEFYRGKTIRIVVGFAPGGGFDTLARLIAKHLPKYMPGNPNSIVENKPGAGSMLTANEVYKTAEKDGTVIAHFNEQMVLLQAVGQQGIEFDARRYNWLGSMIESPSACAVRTDAGINAIQDTIAGKQIVIAADAPGSTTHDVPAVLNAAAGTNFKIVPGYAGTSQQRLAFERKEADGVCFTWESLRSTARAWFEANPPTAKVLVIMGERTPDHPWLRGVPAAETLAKDAQGKQLMQAVNLPSTMSKPYAVAPEVPRDRVEALRVGFARVAEDKDFLAEAEKAQLEITYNSAPRVEAKVAQILGMPAPVIEKLKTILK